MNIPTRVTIDGKLISAQTPILMGASEMFGSNLSRFAMETFTPELARRMEAESLATIEREMPEVARAYVLAVAINEDNSLTVALVSRSAVDQLAELAK